MEDIAQTLRIATKLAKQGKYDEAADKFLEAVEFASEDPRGWFGLGVCCARAGKYEEAREALDEAIRLGHPRASEALHKLVDQAQTTGEGKKRAEKAQRSAPEEGAAPTAEPEPEAQAQVPTETPQEAPAEAKEEKAKKEREEEKPEEKLDLGKRVRVMLIEDKGRDRQAISQALHDYIENIDIVETPFAESASRTIVNMGIFDVAIMDWNTSPRDAKNLLDFLKLKQPHIPVIVLTQAWSEDMAREAVQAGADYCLVKASGYARVLPFVIEQRFKQSFVLQEKIETELSDYSQEGRRKYLDSIDRPMLLTNQEGEVLDVNLPCADLLHITRDRLIGESCERLFRHEAEEESFFPLKEAFAEGEAISTERYEPSLEKSFRVTTYPVHEEDTVEYLHMVEPVEAGEQKKEEGLLADALKTIHAPVYLKDPEGRFLYVNEAFAHLAGCQPADLNGKPQQETAADELGRELAEEEKKARETGQPLVGQKLLDGRWFSCALSPMGGAEEEPASIAAVLQDISEAKRPSGAGGTDLLRMVTELAGQVAFELDTDGRIRLMNAAGTRLTGRPAHELSDHPFADLVMEEAREHWQDLFQRVSESGESISSEEMPLIKQDGQALNGEITLTPMAGEKPDSIASICGLWRDTSDKSRVQKALDILSGEEPLE